MEKYDETEIGLGPLVLPSCPRALRTEIQGQGYEKKKMPRADGKPEWTEVES